MFKETHKLHLLRSVIIDGLSFKLCYFWQDDSISSADYRRCFVFIPSSEYSENEDYDIQKLSLYIISFALAKVLYNSNPIIY